MKRILLTIVIVLVIEAVGWTVFVYTGAYNVSTANHDNAVMNWWIDTGTTHSIKAHATGITVPPLDNPAMVQEGFKHYRAMCMQCHGAPGKHGDDIAEGLWPKAPDLSKAVSDWTPAQLFWITKNGIKFSAMPGWGPTHSDEKIWDMVAFLEKLPHLSPAEYQQMESTIPPEAEGSGE
jgi:mono/diheme cytochrome c family protein